MRLSTGKMSNYVGQAKEKDIEKVDSYLVSVDRDLQNLWRLVNASLKLVGSQTAVLNTDSAFGFSYLPQVNPSPLATPTAYVGHSAVAFCNSNSNLYVYNTSNTSWVTNHFFSGNPPSGNFYGNEIGWSAAVNNSYTIVSNSSITAGTLDYVTFQNNREIKVSQTGKYYISWYLSNESSVANKHVLAGLMVNSTTTLQDDGKNHIEHNAANRELPIGGCAMLSLAVDDVVGVGIGSTDSITIRVDHVGLCVHMV